jgi:transposase
MKMRQKSQTRQTGAAKAVKGIRSATRKQYSAEEKIRIVLDGLRCEENIAELCRLEAIAQSTNYKWSKKFMEAGKRRLSGDTARLATTGEVSTLRREARELKEVVVNQKFYNPLEHLVLWSTSMLRQLKEQFDRYL